MELLAYKIAVVFTCVAAGWMARLLSNRDKKLNEWIQKSGILSSEVYVANMNLRELAEKYIAFSELSKKMRTMKSSRHSKKLLIELQEYSEGLNLDLDGAKDEEESEKDG